MSRLDPPLLDDEDLVRALRFLQLLLVKHPVAARAAVRALVAEGRRFAETDEGRAWREALAGTSLVRNGRQLWESTSLALIDEEAPAVFPSLILEGLVQAAVHGDLEGLLAQLYRDGTPA